MSAEPQVTEQVAEYLCPGERSAISRAVHLGRMAGYYPACRACPHRDDTGTLAARQIQRLVETRRRSDRAPLFHDEAVAGVFWNELDPTIARRIGSALGVLLRRDRPPAAEGPVVVVATDGRPSAPELVAAAGEGLRWAGCHLIDVGEASAPCVAFAVDHLEADGGLLVGNPTGQAHAVGLTFWEAAARPLSSGGQLEKLRAIFEAGPDRPTRRFGSMRRFSADVPYLAGLAEQYHALRPLRLVLESNCPPLFGYLERLTANVACRVVPSRVGANRLGEQAIEAKAHFALIVDDDARRCRLVDDLGRPVADDRVLLVLAHFLLDAQPEGPIVLPQDAPPRVAAEIRRRGGCVVHCGPRRAEMHQAMRTHRALLGGGPGGRFWHRSATGHASADALWTLTVLLRLLSRSDRPLSQVLDADAPVR